MSFVALHNHSEYTFHAGVPSVSELVLRAKGLGMPAVALTDTNRISGLIMFYQLCRQQGIKPILGVELDTPNNPPESVVLLAKNLNGYRDLCELVSRRHLDKEKFSFDDISTVYYPDLFIITRTVRLLKVLAGSPNRDSVYAELVNQDDISRRQSREVEQTAAVLNIPLVATNNTYFLDKSDWELHKILTAIGLNSTVSRLAAGETAPAGAWLKDARRMQRLFPDHNRALATTGHIAEQCNVTFHFGSWILPRIDPPAGYSVSGYLRELALEGLKKNYGGKPDYERARQIQEKELAIIDRLGYSSYFLMVKEVRDWANKKFKKGYRRQRDCTIMRGSAANSITFYNIGASDLDPIRHHLYFERFLNEDRASPPDADLDFGWDERDRVIDYFFDHWGSENVAVLCTVNHFKARAAFREVAKVYGFSDEQITGYMEHQEPLDRSELDRIIGYAEKVKGKPRFLGQHPGGLVVTNDPICRHVALERSGGTKDRIITQIDMHSGIDELGLVKFDILGNGSLSVLRDALDQIREQGHHDPEVWKETKVHNNPLVRNLIRNGRTRGVFYIESPAQTRLNKKALAESFEEVGITSSLVRPAGAFYTKTFVERHRKMKQGVKDWDYLHPSLEPILNETHGCLVFQEDIIKICHDLAGMSFARADQVRKMMNSLHEGMPSDYERVSREFTAGCRRVKGLSRRQAAALWEGINTFKGFSFCKSHSLSYAQLSYKCAYLKAYYPAQFLAAVISNNHGFYSTDVYLNEARRFGIRINPFDINKSRTKYIGRGMYITPGLMHIKHLSETSLDTITKDKGRQGPFTNLIDFIRRTGTKLRETEALIKVGAFDQFGMNQPELLALLYAEYGRVKPAAPDLFEYARDFRQQLHPGLKDFTLTEKCLHELELLGFMVSGNILDILQLHPAAKHAVPVNDIYRYTNQRVKIFGNPITSRIHLVNEGDQMQFLTMEDASGTADVVFWPDTFERYKEILFRPGPYQVWGRVQAEWGTYCLIADRVRTVSWDPRLVDFELASKRLLRSYTEQFVYEDIKYAESAA